MYCVGVAGFGMRRFAIPLAPAVVGLILGPLAEQQFRRALAIGGSPWIFVSRPISLAVLLLAAVGVVGPRLWRRRSVHKSNRGRENSRQ
jgi:putative tricarboxylic transport membrane protein